MCQLISHEMLFSAVVMICPSSAWCHSAKHVLTVADTGSDRPADQSLPSPLTLCTSPRPHFLTLHCLRLWYLNLPSYWLVWSHPLNNPPLPSLPFLHSHLREGCRGDRGHCLWRANVHRIPQRCYKEVRKRTSEPPYEFIQHLHCNSY